MISMISITCSNVLSMMCNKMLVLSMTCNKVFNTMIVKVLNCIAIILNKINVALHNYDLLG